jgi:hypothetical protein
VENGSTGETARSLGRCETAQNAAHSRQNHCVHDLLAQHGQGAFSRSVGDLYQVALPHDGDIADTRMLCQGPAHIHYSSTAEKAVHLERGTVR